MKTDVEEGASFRLWKDIIIIIIIIIIIMYHYHTNPLKPRTRMNRAE